MFLFLTQDVSPQKQGQNNANVQNLVARITATTKNAESEPTRSRLADSDGGNHIPLNGGLQKFSLQLVGTKPGYQYEEVQTTFTFAIAYSRKFLHVSFNLL
jgi:hypothetical protein